MICAAPRSTRPATRAGFRVLGWLDVAPWGGTLVVNISELLELAPDGDPSTSSVVLAAATSLSGGLEKSTQWAAIASIMLNL
jgi:hypothetical protein